MEARKFTKAVEPFIAAGRPRVAVGLQKADTSQIINPLIDLNIAEVVVVAPGDGDDAETRLVTMLIEGEVDGLLRGTLDSVKTINAYSAITGENDHTCPALIENPSGRQFFFSAVTNHEGHTKEQRLHEARSVAELCRRCNVEPRVAVYSAARPETVDSLRERGDAVSEMLAGSYDDAQWLVRMLKEIGLKADNVNIELNSAIDAGYDVHVPVSGIVGNQVTRAFMACGGRMMAAPRVGLSRPYEDNSRTEGSLVHHFQWLVAWINAQRSSRA